jgi:branched-chain amino acid transport system ATP-binding protein
MPPILELVKLDAGYKDVTVVHDLEFSIESGEVVALLGPNGAGKTTTLLTVAGMLPVLGGCVKWQGEPCRDPSYRRVRNGMAVVTERSVLQRLTVEGNLRLGRGEAEDALGLFPELRPLLKRRAGLLSGGEQQMLTMARAIAARPKALLLDEVSAGLAPIVASRLFAAAREAADNGAAVLLVEQQLRRAVSTADRAIVLSGGRSIFAGQACDLTKRPDVIAESFFAGTEAALRTPPALGPPLEPASSVSAASGNGNTSETKR